MICVSPRSVSFYVTGCHSVSLFIPLDEREAYVSDIVRGEVSLHLRNGNLCVFTCVCTSCQMGVYDSTAGGGGDHCQETQALKNRHKPYNTATKAPSDHSSVIAPINHIYTAAAAATAQRHHLYSALLLNTHHCEAPSSLPKSGF